MGRKRRIEKAKSLTRLLALAVAVCMIFTLPAATALAEGQGGEEKRTETVGETAPVGEKKDTPEVNGQKPGDTPGADAQAPEETTKTDEQKPGDLGQKDQKPEESSGDTACSECKRTDGSHEEGCSKSENGKGQEATDAKPGENGGEEQPADATPSDVDAEDKEKEEDVNEEISENVKKFLDAIEEIRGLQEADDAEAEEVIAAVQKAQSLYDALSDEEKELEQVAGCYAMLQDFLDVNETSEEDPVAQIGETGYPSLEEAVNAAENGETVTLVKDEAVLGEELYINKKITLDLNGKNLKLTQYRFWVNSGGDLTVTGNGRVLCDINVAFAVPSGGNLTIENGTFESSNRPIVECVNGNVIIKDGAFTCTKYYQASSIIRVSGKTAELKIENGTFSATEYGNALGGAHYDGMYGVYISGGGKLVLGTEGSAAGPTITTVYAPIAMNNTEGSGTITIYGGTYTSKCALKDDGVNLKNHSEKYNTALYLSADANVTIKGGTFIAEKGERGDEGSETYAISIPYKKTGLTLDISGGNFKSTGEAIYAPEYGSLEGNGDPQVVNVSGGTFSSDIKKYIVEGKTQDASGRVVEDTGDVIPYDTVATVTVGGITTTYDSLSEAVEKAGAGAVVTLYKDAEESITVKAGQDITLDLNGCTLRGRGKNTITNNGKLTINGNGTVIGTNGSAAYTAVSNSTGAECIIQGGTFTRSPYIDGGDQNSTGSNSNYTIHNQGTMTFKGGTVKNNSQKSSMVGNMENATMYIEGGTFEQTTYIALINKPGAVMNISGGSITGPNEEYETIQAYGTVNISGGTVSGNSIGAWAYKDNTYGNIETKLTISGSTIIRIKEIRAVAWDLGGNGSNWPTNPAEIIISGTPQISGEVFIAEKVGNIKGGSPVVKVSEAEESTCGNVSISGGTFDKEVPARYCADGFEAVQENGKYVVKTKAATPTPTPAPSTGSSGSGGGYNGAGDGGTPRPAPAATPVPAAAAPTARRAAGVTTVPSETEESTVAQNEDAEEQIEGNDVPLAAGEEEPEKIEEEEVPLSPGEFTPQVEKGGHFLWWIPALVLVALLCAGALWFFLVGKRRREEEEQ